MNKQPAIVTRDSLRDMLQQASAEQRIHIVGRALVALFNRQTRDEQSSNDTNRTNSIGFSGADAKSGSLTAKTYLKNRTLTEWQVNRWLAPAKNGYPRICKYAVQLNSIAIEKAARRRPLTV